MTEDYVKVKIQEALKATDGDKKDAQKLLITWAVRDQPLLLGIAKPHLRALVAARIEQIARGGSKKESESSAEHLDPAIFGHTKGEKRHLTKVPPPKSSARQASVMHQLAAAFKKKS